MKNPSNFLSAIKLFNDCLRKGTAYSVLVTDNEDIAVLALLEIQKLQKEYLPSLILKNKNKNNNNNNSNYYYYYCNYCYYYYYL